MPEKQRGAVLEALNTPYKVVDDIDVPEPAEGQVLMKSISTAINPVETFMSTTGLFVPSFPIVLGSDTSSIVTKSTSPSFPPGTRICGCARLGFVGYGPFQEQHLYDTRYAIRVPDSISYNEAAVLGVGTLTAYLGLVQGLKIDLSGGKKDEWVVILGGAGSVGQYAVQIAKEVGYRVLATASKRSKALLERLGAEEVVDYSGGDEFVFGEVKRVTGGEFFGVFDAVNQSEKLGRRLLDEVSTTQKKKVYATTDDWSPMEDSSGHSLHRIKLGDLAREEESGQPDLEESIIAAAKFITGLLEKGKIVPNEFVVAEKGGFEGINEAVDLQRKGAGGKKVVVELQKP